MHRENMIALSHQYGKQFKHIQELDKIDSSNSKTSGYSKGAVVNFNRFGYEYSRKHYSFESSIWEAI